MRVHIPKHSYLLIVPLGLILATILFSTIANMDRVNALSLSSVPCEKTKYKNNFAIQFANATRVDVHRMIHPELVAIDIDIESSDDEGEILRGGNGTPQLCLLDQQINNLRNNLTPHEINAYYWKIPIAYRVLLYFIDMIEDSNQYFVLTSLPFIIIILMYFIYGPFH